MTDVYLKSIKSIYDTTKESNIIWKELSIQKDSSKYSNTKIPVYKLSINSNKYLRSSTLLIKLNCLTCFHEQEITLTCFMRKVNNNKIHCILCVNLEKTKCETHSQFIQDNFTQLFKDKTYKNNKIKITKLSFEQNIQKSIVDWKLENETFKTEYFNIHLTIEQFENIRNKIINIGNKGEYFSDLSGWYYEPCYRVYNQTRYTPMLINIITKNIKKPYYISFKCENCDIEFTHRDLEIIKKKIKLFCRKCSLTNKIFRLRKHTLNSGKNIIWQSSLEKKFIDWCEENTIKIQNGPNLPYIFKEKQREYRVDFELPYYNKIIELKDNHCWHKEQIESGKFAAKENIAIEWAKNNNYIFHLLFPKDITRFQEDLLKIEVPKLN